ncbi:hypothetical protein [Streptomyces spongiicola]|uniref:hypothetical protein n=1 Tax=Streptomyces spongiicola TaxID=1690221 RepID=UPI0011C1A69C|nr:hypothetical protein [Streptomyces spongiicola]
MARLVSRNATAASWTAEDRPAASVSTTLPSATARTPSQITMSRRRSQRSTRTPAGSRTRSSGSRAANDTADITSGESVVQSTLSGYETP